jgi:hypothetical protein
VVGGAAAPGSPPRILDGHRDNDGASNGVRVGPVGRSGQVLGWGRLGATFSRSDPWSQSVGGLC